MAERKVQAEEANSEDRSSAFLKSASLTKPKGSKGGFWSDKTKNTNRQSIGSWKGGQLNISKAKISRVTK